MIKLMTCYKCMHSYSLETSGMKRVKGLANKQRRCPKCGCMVYT